jgi:hypothetical protein
MMELCSRYRGVQQEYRVLEGTDRAILRYSLPLSGAFKTESNHVQPGTCHECPIKENARC